MRFTINLPATTAPWALSATGIDTDAFIDHDLNLTLDKATLPHTFHTTCTTPEAVVRRTLTLAPSHGTEVLLIERRGPIRPATPSPGARR